jgi:large subunit ribosomal protein L7/L12
MNKPLSDGDLNEIREAIFAGRMIEAIKLYRQYTTAGLSEAKDAVEEMERKLRAELPGRFVADQSGREQQEAKSAKGVPGVQTGKGCFGVFVCIALVILTLVTLALWG